jgi:hypothetical protein
LFSCKSIPFSSPNKEETFAQYLYKQYESSGSKFYTCEQLDITIVNGESKRFKAKLNIHRGEFIFANVNFLGIELGRIELTPDSIKIINRIKKSYYFGEIKSLNSILNLHLSYYQIEDLILKGIVVDKDENRRRFSNHIYKTEDSYCYDFADSQNLNVKAFFNKDSFQESRIEILNGNSDFYLIANFNDYDESRAYPKEIKINLKKENYLADINIKVGKISFNKLEKKYFVVNDTYSEILF